MQLEAPDASPLGSPTAGLPNGRIDALKHAAALFHLGPVARNGLSLARNDSRLREPHSGVKGPGLLLRYRLPSLRCPFGPSAPLPQPVGQGRFIASGPLQLPQAAWLTAPSASTPLWDSYIPPDQSVQQNLPPADPPSESARFLSLPAARFYY